MLGLQFVVTAVSCETEMIRVPYQEIPMANHSSSSMKQFSARQCWSASACIRDSVAVLQNLLHMWLCKNYNFREKTATVVEMHNFLPRDCF